jgi:hypothetical protein
VEQETADTTAADAAAAAAAEAADVRYAAQQAAADARQAAVQQAAAQQAEAEEDASPWHHVTDTERNSMDARRANSTMVQLVPSPCPPAMQSAGVGAQPDLNVDSVSDFRPSALLERVAREESLRMTDDEMFNLIGSKVVLHGTVFSCDPGSKTLEVEIDEFESRQTHETNVTDFDEATLEVPLRMVYQAVVITRMNKNL